MHLATPSDSNNCLYRPESPSVTNGSASETYPLLPLLPHLASSSLELCGQSKAPELSSDRR